MSDKRKAYDTICEIAIEKLNVSLEVFKSNLKSENNQKMGTYIHHEIIKDEKENPEKIILKQLAVKSSMAHFVYFITTYSYYKNLEFSKIIGIELKKQ